MILDTNALSAFLQADGDLLALLAGTPELHLPVIVLGEYRFGLGASRKRRVLLPMLERIEGQSVILVVDATTARTYAEIRGELRAAGSPIPQNDLWIAALARQHALEIVSRDAHFDCVRGARRRAW